MGAIENIRQLASLLINCKNEMDRVRKMPYNPSDEKHIRYRYNAYCDQIKKLEDVAGDLIEFCKDVIENSHNINIELYAEDVYDSLKNALVESKEMARWFRSHAESLNHFDGVKYPDLRECDRDSLFEWNEDGELWMRHKGSNTFHLISNFQDQNPARSEYCRLRDSFEIKLFSRLYQYEESKRGNVNTDYDVQLFLFAHTVYLYTALHNEIKPLLKDAEYAGLPLEKLQTATPEQQGKRTKPVRIPDELNKPKGRPLLRKLIKDGYCDKYYNWDDTKWNPGKSRLALSCFAYRASAYLKLSTKMNKEGELNTSWQPFEALFTYQGKEEGKDKLMQAKRDFMRTHDRFDPEELGVIDKLFR